MQTQTPEEAANEQTIRKLYSLANATTKDTPGFVAMFGNGGYFFDAGAGKKKKSPGQVGALGKYPPPRPLQDTAFVQIFPPPSPLPRAHRIPRPPPPPHAH